MRRTRIVIAAMALMAAGWARADSSCVTEELFMHIPWGHGSGELPLRQYVSDNKVHYFEYHFFVSPKESFYFHISSPANFIEFIKSRSGKVISVDHNYDRQVENAFNKKNGKFFEFLPNFLYSGGIFLVPEVILNNQDSGIFLDSEGKTKKVMSLVPFYRTASEHHGGISVVGGKIYCGAQPYLIDSETENRFEKKSNNPDVYPAAYAYNGPYLSKYLPGRPNNERAYFFTKKGTIVSIFENIPVPKNNEGECTVYEIYNGKYLCVRFDVWSKLESSRGSFVGYFDMQGHSLCYFKCNDSDGTPLNSRDYVVTNDGVIYQAIPDARGISIYKYVPTL